MGCSGAGVCGGRVEVGRGRGGGGGVVQVGGEWRGGGWQ